jgi:hypothetical protein
MSVLITVKESPASKLRKLERALNSQAEMHEFVARVCQQEVRGYLFALNRSRPNAIGGRRTNFWEQAAKSTTAYSDAKTARVSITKIGMAQRYYGGTIKPVNKTYLTIPARPEAHGHVASDFPLRFVKFGRAPNAPAALVTTERVAGRSRVAGSGVKTSRTSVLSGKIMFWLSKGVTQAPDPDVIPSDARLKEVISRELVSFLGVLE